MEKRGIVRNLEKVNQSNNEVVFQQKYFFLGEHGIAELRNELATNTDTIQGRPTK